MQVQRVNITLPQRVMKLLRAEVPQGKRSAFIASAITEKLAKNQQTEQALQESLAQNYDFYKKEAEIWKITETEGWPD